MRSVSLVHGQPAAVVALLIRVCLDSSESAGPPLSRISSSFERETTWWGRRKRRPALSEPVSCEDEGQHTHTHLPTALCVPGQAVALYLFSSGLSDTTQVYGAHSPSRSHDATVSICFLLSKTRVDGGETQLRGPQSLSVSQQKAFKFHRGGA